MYSITIITNYINFILLINIFYKVEQTFRSKPFESSDFLNAMMISGIFYSIISVIIIHNN